MEQIHKTSWYPRIGEIYLMRFDGCGSEQGGTRPGLVFQCNKGNINSPNIIALPLTSSLKKSSQPTHITIKASETGLSRDSLILCENPERMSKAKVGRFITELSRDDMKRVAEASLLATSAIAFLDYESLLRIWNKANTLNDIQGNSDATVEWE